jgi:DNA-binding SARP family transcriptional activator
VSYYIVSYHGKGEKSWGYMTKRKFLRFGLIDGRQEFDKEFAELMSELMTKAVRQAGGHSTVLPLKAQDLSFDDWVEEIDDLFEKYFPKLFPKLEGGFMLASFHESEARELYDNCVTPDEIYRGEIESWEGG